MPCNEIDSAARELADAVTDVLGTLNFYIGQAARTAVSSESVARYRRLVAARDAVAAALPGTEAP